MPLDIERWKKAKRENKVTYDELVILSGIPKSTITSIFSGATAAPRIDTIDAIERALGLSDEKRTLPGNISEGEREWLYLYRNLAKSNIKMIYEMVKSLLPEEQPFLAGIMNK